MATADILMTPEQLSYAQTFTPQRMKQEFMSNPNQDTYTAATQEELIYWPAFLPVGGYQQSSTTSSMVPGGHYDAIHVNSEVGEEVAATALNEMSRACDEPGLGITTGGQDMYYSPNETALSPHLTPQQHNHMVLQDYQMLTPNWRYTNTSTANSPMSTTIANGIRLQTTFANMADNLSYEQANITTNNDTNLSTNSSRLQEPINFQSNISRQTSISSCPPGLTTSTTTTPMSGSTSNFTPASASTYWPNASPNTAHALSSNATPIASPQSRPLIRSPLQQSEYIQRRENDNHTYPRGKPRKPHIRPSLSESNVSRISSPHRRRALSAAIPSQMSHSNNSFNTPGLAGQLPLPACPPSVLIGYPIQQQHQNIGSSEHSFVMNATATVENSCPDESCHDIPSSPPLSDMRPTGAPYLAPVRQDPKFAGDLYTPRYKRRNSENRWEGWCGYCKPGRWLDLKNSRYWEDKYRNHGICARTKTKFVDPEEIRFVNADTGNVESGFDNSNNGSGGSSSTLRGESFIDSRVNRKREGLCGKCKKWIPMDGVRTKARDRPVGWWVHAYACHEQGRQKEDGEIGQQLMVDG